MTSSRLSVKVVPGASRTKIAGWLGDTLKITVSAPPERGRANAAVLELIADTLEVPKSSLLLISGESSARKTIEIRGLDEKELRMRLSS